jgi:hypothetical protein
LATTVIVYNNFLLKKIEENIFWEERKSYIICGYRLSLGIIQGYVT